MFFSKISYSFGNKLKLYEAMKKITKKHLKQIREGNHATLMDCLDFLLDSYEEDKYDLGYGACLADMSVRSQRLAEYILDKVIELGKLEKISKDGSTIYVFNDKEMLSAIIEDYFNEALNK